MAEIYTGRLSFDKGKWKIVFFDEKRKRDSTLFCQKDVFAVGFAPKETEETEVHFERDTNPQQSAIRVRPKDEEWQEHAKPVQSALRRNDVSRSRLPGEFHNPYNFVPAIPRNQVENELGDRHPSGHDHFLGDKFSGRLRVKLRVETPLLLPDTARVEIIERDAAEAKKDHKVFAVKTDENGKPVINPTAIKGMLRSAYETVTNSRLSVFKEHHDRLAFRGEAKAPVAARIEKKGNSLFIREISKVAVLTRYRKHYHGERDKAEDKRALKYASTTTIPPHGAAVWVQTSPRKDRRRGRPIGLKVDSIKKRHPHQTTLAGYEPGWVCVTGANAKDKVYERVFIEEPHNSLIPVTPEHEKMWEELIRNYQDTHKMELQKRKQEGKEPYEYFGNNPGETAWSRQVYDNRYTKLKNETLCYLVKESNRIKAIIPVMISRRLYEKSPLELLPDTTRLRPAENIDQLSPADRVFGWVKQREGRAKQKAYRGQVRIGAVNCLGVKVTDAAGEETYHQQTTEFFDGDEDTKNGLPLQILGQPKPQQGRFYVAKDKAGNAQNIGLNNEEAGYQGDKGLRGRKVYPHHRNLPADYWVDEKKWQSESTENDLSQEKLNHNGTTYFREYIRPKADKRRDSQNRSIQGWVKPATEFEFDIHFINLSDVELGALVWILSLPEGHFHRFGGGKPLGFGSVRLSLAATEIYTGGDLQKRYATLDAVALPTADAQHGVKQFKAAVEEAYSQSFEQAPFIKAFLKAASGFDKPTHYPRTTPNPNPDGESFAWFVANNKIAGGTVKHGIVLSNLWEDDGLPILQDSSDRKRY